MKFSLPLVFLLVFTFSMSAHAQLGNAPLFSTKQSTKQLQVNSSQQAAQMAKSRFGGKVLKVQKNNSGYRVKLIKTDGHIISVHVDAKTGRISGGK